MQQKRQSGHGTNEQEGCLFVLSFLSPTSILVYPTSGQADALVTIGSLSITDQAPRGTTHQKGEGRFASVISLQNACRVFSKYILLV